MTIEEQNYRALVAGNDAAARAVKTLISAALERDATAFDICDVGTGTPDHPYGVQSRLKIQAQDPGRVDRTQRLASRGRARDHRQVPTSWHRTPHTGHLSERAV